MIVNADGAILGRLASKIAKELLRGENVIVVNSEKIVISGNPEAIFKRFHEKKDRGYSSKGPFYPKYPDRILVRSIRGMLPYKKEKGKKALKKLKVYYGNPDNLKGEKISKTSEDLECKFVNLEQVCKKLGAKLG
ncbi:50S ribosomal protein L13 [Candidatus Micrarchaeota archaeon RBG_16_36_9]|nr:MAG: 50S ribosomal protein L13 [Candidatus Micrarchaeota archaeon RBG_16_36_9]